VANQIHSTGKPRLTRSIGTETVGLQFPTSAARSPHRGGPYGSVVLRLHPPSLHTPRTNRPSRLSRLHLVIEPISMFLGSVNGFLGLKFANASFSQLLWYVILIATVFGGVLGALLWRRKRVAEKFSEEDGLGGRFSSYLRVRDNNAVNEEGATPLMKADRMIEGDKVSSGEE
jgi:hypothetical protein